MSGTAPTATDAAIAAALEQNWEQAILLNKQILEMEGETIDVLNRLAFAYTQMGKTKDAKSCYQKVLTIDPYNPIAQKNMQKLSQFHQARGTNGVSAISPLMFLEEPGKTKIVTCVNLAPSKILEGLRCGQEVTMKVKKHCIEVRDINQIYLGALPDDISFKLGRLIGGGNTYRILVRSTAKNVLTVFIRELTRGKQFQNQPSFTTQSTFVAHGRYDDMVDKGETTGTGEEQGEEE